MVTCLCEQNEVRSQDTVFVIAGATTTVDGRELVWKFVCDNWTMLHSRYSGIFLLARLVKAGGHVSLSVISTTEVVWCSGNALVSVIVVILRQARLVLDG